MSEIESRVRDALDAPDVKQAARALKEDVSKVREDAGALASAVGDKAELSTRDLIAYVERQARTNTAATLGIALGAGFVLGAVLTGRR